MQTLLSRERVAQELALFNAATSAPIPALNGLRWMVAIQVVRFWVNLFFLLMEIISRFHKRAPFWTLLGLKRSLSGWRHLNVSGVACPGLSRGFRARMTNETATMAAMLNCQA